VCLTYAGLGTDSASYNPVVPDACCAHALTRSERVGPVSVRERVEWGANAAGQPSDGAAPHIRFFLTVAATLEVRGSAEGFLHGTIPRVRPDHPCDEVGDSGAERRNSGAEGRKNTLRERVGPATVRAAERAMRRGKHCKIRPPDKEDAFPME